VLSHGEAIAGVSARGARCCLMHSPDGAVRPGGAAATTSRRFQGRRRPKPDTASRIRNEGSPPATPDGCVEIRDFLPASGVACRRRSPSVAGMSWTTRRRGRSRGNSVRSWIARQVGDGGPTRTPSVRKRATPGLRPLSWKEPWAGATRLHLSLPGPSQSLALFPRVSRERRPVGRLPG
jgi:hypothetical protein